MRKLLILLILFSSFTSSYSQSPASFKYQAVARNADGSIIAGQLVSFRISILKGSIAGNSVYSETHLDTTNSLGMVNLQIGNGTDVFGSLDTIKWGADVYFLKVEIDKTGGTSFQNIGTSQLLSVPYALYSKTTGNLSQSSTNYYGTSSVYILASDTAYKSIPGLDPTINVPDNSTVLISTTGTVYGTTWSSFALIRIGLFIDGTLPVKGGVQSLWVVTDNTKSSGGANWSINFPVKLSPGFHTIEVKAESQDTNNECSVTIDNGGYFDYSTLTVTMLKN